MKVVYFNQSENEKWDNFIENCPMGTFLHSRKFLSYHGDRFKDKSIIIKDKNDNWLAVFPAAEDLNNKNIIISHPGSTYGGFVHKGKLIGQLMVDSLELIKDFYKENEYTKIIYKAIPSFYFEVPYFDDVYALFKSNALLYRRDLSCTIHLQEKNILSSENQSKMRNMIRKSIKNGVTIENNNEHIEEYWNLLNKNLNEKYNKKPTHTLDELKRLFDLFPNNIEIICALRNQKIIAGSVLFKKKKVIHTQYLSASDEGKEFFALDMVIQHCIEKARYDGLYFFDFGISTEQDGKILNSGLYLSKAKHGGSGMLHDFYSIELV